MRQHPSLYDEAYARLREWIEEGTLSRGTMTSEGKLCGQLGMSRTPVRAALQRLALEGFLRIVPKRGILILEPNLLRVGNSLDIAAALLLFAVEQSRRMGLGEVAAAAEEGRTALRRLTDEDPPGRYAEVERRAFTAMAEAVRNAELSAAFALTLRRLDWDRSALRRWQPPHRGRTREALDRLLAAAAAGSADAGPRVLDYFHNLRLLWS